MEETEPFEPRKDPILFVTLGMFILDDIQGPPPEKKLYTSIPGGAGSYAALGARLVAARADLSPKSVAWIVDAGHDFPRALRNTLDSWDTEVLIRDDASRATTRGWNGYADGSERRAFKYTTPKRRLEARDLTDAMIEAKSFHLICSAARCGDLVKSVEERRGERHARGEARHFIWEPVPDLCVPEERDKAIDASRHVTIVSPNHMELCAFFGGSGEIVDERGASSVDGNFVEDCARSWLEKLEKLEPGSELEAIVVRAGKEGCMVLSRSGRVRWIGAYHQDAKRVVDPTGGGNAFVGGLAIAFAAGDDVIEAACWGTVAASFAIEQVGLPGLCWSEARETSGSEREKEQQELWNGESVVARWRDFCSREDEGMKRQEK